MNKNGFNKNELLRLSLSGNLKLLKSPLCCVTPDTGSNNHHYINNNNTVAILYLFY